MAGDPHLDLVCDVRVSLVVGVAGADHHLSPGGSHPIASAGVGMGQRWALQSGLLLCHLLSTQIVYKLLIGGQSFIRVHQRIHDSHKAWLTII